MCRNFKDEVKNVPIHVTGCDDSLIPVFMFRLSLVEERGTGLMGAGNRVSSVISNMFVSACVFLLMQS